MKSFKQLSKKSSYSLYGVSEEDGNKLVQEVKVMDFETLGCLWRELYFNINILKCVNFFHEDRLRFDLAEARLHEVNNGLKMLENSQQWVIEEEADAKDLAIVG